MLRAGPNGEPTTSDGPRRRVARLGPRGHRPHPRGGPATCARAWRRALRETVGRCALGRVPRRDDHARRLARATAMRVESVELRRIRLPLVAPFRTSLGTQHDRDVLLVRVLGPDGEGWGECVAFGEPLLLVRVRRRRARRDPAAPASAPVRPRRGLGGRGRRRPRRRARPPDGERGARDGGPGRRAARARRLVRGVSRRNADGGRLRRVGRDPRGHLASCCDTVERLPRRGLSADQAEDRAGHDVEPVRAVRERFGDILFQVDANAAYTRSRRAASRRSSTRSTCC